MEKQFFATPIGGLDTDKGPSAMATYGASASPIGCGAMPIADTTPNMMAVSSVQA